MIRGKVNSHLEATIPVRVLGLKGFRDVNAIVDTGFTSYLTLPESTIHELGLVSHWQTTVILADGSDQDVAVYRAKILWHQHEREITIYPMGQEILVGMLLIENNTLMVEATRGGNVIIEPLPSVNP